MGLIIHKIAVLLVRDNMTLQQLFEALDYNRSGFWEQSEQRVALKTLLPGLTPSEEAQMFGALSTIDINHDGRISSEELHKAFAAGGVTEASVLASETAALDAVQIQVRFTYINQRVCDVYAHCMDACACTHECFLF